MLNPNDSENYSAWWKYWGNLAILPRIFCI